MGKQMISKAMGPSHKVAPTHDLPSTERQQIPRLHTLPPELRSMIYHQLFSAESICLTDAIHGDPEPALAQIPRLRQEVLSAYYNHVQCRLQKLSPFESSFALPKNLPIERIQHLHITVPGSFKIYIHMSNAYRARTTSSVLGPDTWIRTGHRHRLTLTLSPNAQRDEQLLRAARNVFAEIADSLTDHLSTALSTEDMHTFLSESELTRLVQGTKCHYGTDIAIRAKQLNSEADEKDVSTADSV